VTVDGYSAYTDSGGNYIISDIPAGTYRVVFQKEGYETLIL